MLALLVRRPGGNWEDLHGIDNIGTRPIVVLNEVKQTLMVAYTEANSGGDILYKLSDTGTISFGSRQTLMSGALNNVTSTKQTFVNQLVIMAATDSVPGNMHSVLFSP